MKSKQSCVGYITLAKMLKFCLNYPIGQLSSFPLPPCPRQSTIIDFIGRKLVENGKVNERSIDSVKEVKLYLHEHIDGTWQAFEFERAVRNSLGEKKCFY